jgi:type IV pilus assembly protein PilA
MKKKGFTLIELLAVIVILALIALIAVPLILNSIERTKWGAYKSNLDMVVKATELYLISNTDYLSDEIGETKELSIKELQNTNFLKEIKNPYGRGMCSGYVSITRLNKSEYDFTPHLNCENNVSNSNEDGLIAYYKFDDFQEPTENLYNKHDLLSGGEIPYTITYYTGSSSTSGHTDPFGGKHAIKFTGGTNPVLRYGRIDGTNTDIVAGEIYTFSVYAKLAEDSEAPSNFYLDVVDRNSIDLAPQLTNTWQRFEVTVLHDNNPSYGFADITINNGASIMLSNPQIERKPYSTPYVQQSRLGNVKDHSMNNNVIPLSNSTTPTWTTNSKVGKGAYIFNGVNTYMDLGENAEFDLTNSGTISLWAKTSLDYPSEDATTRYKGLISKTISGGENGLSYWLDWRGTNTTRFLRFGIGDGTKNEQINISNYDFNDEWRHLVITWDGSKMKIYSNGDKIGERNQTVDPQVISKSFEIGRAFNYGNVHVWDGSIDNVRVYNRTLSETEVKSIFFSEK